MAVLDGGSETRSEEGWGESVAWNGGTRCVPLPRGVNKGALHGLTGWFMVDFSPS